MSLKCFRAVLSCSIAILTARAELTFVSGVSILGGGEVVAHYNAPSGPDLVLVTNSLPRTGTVSHKVDIYMLGDNGALAFASSANFDTIFGALSTLSVSSVAADPIGRGFGIATLIPTDNTRVLGKVVFFDLANGAILTSRDAGFHPDAVMFTPDGTKAIVCNEGEFTAGQAQAPGSISIFDLSGIASSANLLTTAPTVVTVDFNTGLAPGVTLDGLRFNVAGLAAADRHLYIEPEFSVTTDQKAYITLQENNAIATLDLTGTLANKITAIRYLGTIVQRIDASDRDPQNGGVAAININDVVPGLPMPDTIVSFVQGGRRLLATANEGDARTDDGDVARAGSANLVDTVSDGAGDAIFTGSLSDSAGIGRLTISRFDGNTDNDALIEVPTMIGTRSFTLWDEAGTRVFDSGSMLEEFVRTNAPLTFNMNNGTSAAIDTRSDDKGPEPEALAFGEVDGRQYIFVGAERQNGIFQFDITDLNRVGIVGYYNVVDGTSVVTGTRFVSPETIRFVSAAESPTGRPVLIVGYEGIADAIDGSVAILEVTPSSTRIVNGSILTNVTAGQTLVMGFQVSGADLVLVRAVGPSLTPFGVANVLSNPSLSLFSGSTLLDSNEDWGGGPVLRTAFASAGAFPFAIGSVDAALVRQISGTHTAHLAARSSGVVLLELYGLRAASNIGNFSALGRVATGSPLVGGFVLAGTGTKTVLVRAVGPRLGAFGVANAVSDPRLDVFRNGVKVADNDDWGVLGTTVSDSAVVGAFSLEGDAKSAAVRLTLTPGAAYTVHVTGVAGASGTALLEVYEIP